MTSHPARPVRFQITQLRLQSITKSVESIVVVLFTTVMAAFLPNVVARALLGNQMAFEQSAAMEQVLTYIGYIPMVFLLIGAAHFIFAMTTNWMRERKVSELSKVLQSLEMDDQVCTCADGYCSCHDSGSSEMNPLAEVMMDSAKSDAKSAKRGRKAAKRK
jgi:hypothetical protein